MMKVGRRARKERKRRRWRRGENRRGRMSI
jgi:hypothetical protein